MKKTSDVIICSTIKFDNVVHFCKYQIEAGNILGEDDKCNVFEVNLISNSFAGAIFKTFFNTNSPKNNDFKKDNFPKLHYNLFNQQVVDNDALIQ